MHILLPLHTKKPLHLLILIENKKLILQGRPREAQGKWGFYKHSKDI
jgi:hypothetical protein